MQETAALLEKPVAPPRTPQERIADAITEFCGDMRFVYIHAVIFTVWIATRGFGYDHFPFNFLTMTVSLEAIFLSTFILISQNRQQAVADAQNRLVQQALIQMLTDVIDDEKLDQSNEEMITELLQRLDAERVRPIAERVEEINACVNRIESRLGLPPGQI
jgi:uncharacterized membrane protein